MIDIKKALLYEGYKNKLVGPNGEEEIWRDVPGWEGKYQVSNLGRIKGQRGQIKKQSIDSHGYYYVGLWNNYKCYCKKTHQLVLMAFDRLPNKDEVGCHNDGSTTYNNIANLRWDTRKGNQQDMIKHGTVTRGERQPTSKLKEKEVLLIKKILKAKVVSQSYIAKMFKVCQQSIHSINSGKNWGWLHE